MRVDSWCYSSIHHSPCKVIEEQTLWGQPVCRVWLPNQDAVVRVPRSALQPMNVALRPEIEAHRIGYIAAAAKVVEVLEGGSNASDGHVLLAPMESNVIPLPHQIHALSKAVSGDRLRYLLADEVGLGKTIEAGLIMRELKLRGLVRRTLVVAPKGLATQWVAEMQTHFNEQFRLVLGDDIGTLQRLVPGSDNGDSPWSMFDQVIVSLDSVKPMEKRRGWSAERVGAYNRSRYEELITAGWDLVIVDEAHRLGGSTDQVARHRLGQGLAEAAPYVLLLSATPHQGKSDAFHRLMTVLDKEAFPDLESVSRERVMPYVIRTEKRNAVDADNKPLFKPRRTQLIAVSWEPRHHLQQSLYEAVTEYVREGYNQAIRYKKRHIGFLMILMQRLVVSSTRAIRCTLERRLEILKDGERQTSLRLEENSIGSDEFYDMDAEELLDELLTSKVSALQNEALFVETLLESARKCEEATPDAKAEALIEWIYQLQSDENDSELKVLLFTEFVQTQKMLKQFLGDRGITVVTLNGSMSMDERKRAQDAFCHRARVLVSTDAGGEGLNLQFCHVVINYDMPWNPMRVEQRIGRVDRIGQTKVVRAINFVLEESVEFRVLEVLEKKLAVIFLEFGIDKTGDVLDSAAAGELFDELFTSAVLDPEGVELAVEQGVERLRHEIIDVRNSSVLYGISDEPDLQAAERLRSHPLPHWLERMIVCYLNAHGGKATQKRTGWELTWPEGDVSHRCVFSSRDAQNKPDTLLLNLENNRLRGLALNLPQIRAAQPIPCISLSGLPPTISGFWALFEIRLQAGNHQQSQLIRIPLVRRRYIAVFQSEDGAVFMPTARHIWDSLQSEELDVLASMEPDQSIAIYNRLLQVCEDEGKELFDALQHEHQSAIDREEERGAIAFSARRRAIERAGLPEVRHYRTTQCNVDETGWRRELQSARQIVPEIRPLLLMRIMKGGSQ
ncbi:MAG: DEAD/DEAH box helicase [Chlorobium sp.]